jgi:hypothetical protein
LARLRENLDETNIRWKDSGNRMEDVIRGWATVSNSSVEDVMDKLDQLDVDTSNVKETLQAFAKDTGKDFLDWSENVKVAAEKAATELETNAKKIKEGGWLTLEQEQFLAEHAPGSKLGEAAAASLQSKAEAAALQIEESGIDPNAIKRAQDMIDFHTRSALPRSRMSEADLRQSMLEQLSRQVGGEDKRAMQAMLAGDIPIKAFASGGRMGASGLALVGERGPELVSLPGGAFVHPSGSGPGGQTNNFVFNGAVYGLEDLRRVVVEAVRDHAISGGFAGVFAEV